METFHLRVFQRQVLDQCRFLLFATEGVNEGLRKNDLVLVFYNLQNMLNAGANISKMLWGQRGRKLEERRALRASIGVPDDSVLRDATMRNHFEHMDERIDRWWETSRHHNHADKNLGPATAIGGLDPVDMFRMFDPSSADVTFWGERFNLQAIVTEVEKIMPALQAEAEKPHWDP